MTSRSVGFRAAVAALVVLSGSVWFVRWDSASRPPAIKTLTPERRSSLRAVGALGADGVFYGSLYNYTHCAVSTVTFVFTVRRDGVAYSRSLVFRPLDPTAEAAAFTIPLAPPDSQFALGPWDIASAEGSCARPDKRQ